MHFIYIGIAHIVPEACNYSVASSVMEHVLAVHSVMWYLLHGAEHSLHLRSLLGSCSLATLQNLKWKPCTAILFITCSSWFPSISDWSSLPLCRNLPRCPSYRSVLRVHLCKPSSLAALERFLGPWGRKFLSPSCIPISTRCVETPLALFSGIWPSFF